MVAIQQRGRQRTRRLLVYRLRVHSGTPNAYLCGLKSKLIEVGIRPRGGKVHQLVEGTTKRDKEVYHYTSRKTTAHYP